MVQHGANHIKLLGVNSNKRFCKLDCFSTIPKTVYNGKMVKLTIGVSKLTTNVFIWLAPDDVRLDPFL
jgi:hypothetical protein